MKRGTAFFLGVAAGFILYSLLSDLFDKDDNSEKQIKDYGAGS